ETGIPIGRGAIQSWRFGNFKKEIHPNGYRAIAQWRTLQEKREWTPQKIKAWLDGLEEEERFDWGYVQRFMREAPIGQVLGAVEIGSLRLKNNPQVQLPCCSEYAEVVQDTSRCNAMSNGSGLSDRESQRLVELFKASCPKHGIQYQYRPIQLAIDLGYIDDRDFGFDRHHLKELLRGIPEPLTPGDWEAIAGICWEVERWDDITPNLRGNGGTYRGRVEDLKAVLKINNHHLV
ncbi:MAG TPA: hypothetical protein V6C63_12800, partial [Allocoleopsis sp.]